MNSLDAQLSTPLHVAATYDNSRVVELLLAADAKITEVDYQKQNVLHRAAKEGHNKVVDVLLVTLFQYPKKLRGVDLEFGRLVIF